ncbi:KxYKxGKxW signal peptide domain-containing protein [Streptococcus orisratti]|uniref:KxYKxGKxW signal peptide domain-containing protein n=1 Tax=Streptococcus orisratti TaxID=114652 RepID=UPI003CFC898A
MRRKRFNKDYDEVSRKSRVKMHKSGKHWVTTVMSQLGLIRVSKGAGEHKGSPCLAGVCRDDRV